jgi:hypothetical protein
MLAMALIVVMPAISRVMPMAGAMPGMDAVCEHHLAGARHPGPPDSPADPTDKCGYCVLLHHTPVLPAGVLAHVLAALPGESAPALARVDDAYVPPILSARPRGPPRNV